MLRPSHLLYLSSRKTFWWGVQLWHFSVSDLDHFPVTLSFLGPNVFLGKVTQIVTRKARKINTLLLTQISMKVIHASWPYYILIITRIYFFVTVCIQWGHILCEGCVREDFAYFLTKFAIGISVK
jgi:hypothetical protein